MGDREPLISVILPTYNRVGLLEQAVASVFRQTYRRWELVIVDDGSTDQTGSYLERLASKRVRALRLEHSGRPAIARNRGLACARGEYVAFLDSDDLWVEDKLRLQLEALERRRAFRWIYSKASIIDARGAELPESSFRPWRPQRGAILEPLLSHRAAIPCPSVLLERSLLEEAGGFDERLAFCEDYELWLRLAERALAWAVEEPLCKVRLHGENNSWGRLEVNQSFAEIYRAFGERSPDPRLRALARKQRAIYQTFAADTLLRRDHPEEARALLQSALRAHPTFLPAWRLSGKARLPRRLLRLIGRARGNPTSPGCQASCTGVDCRP